jgi:hypothetical protein
MDRGRTWPSRTLSSTSGGRGDVVPSDAALGARPRTAGGSPIPMPGGSSVYRFGPFELDALRGRLFRAPDTRPN